MRKVIVPALLGLMALAVVLVGGSPAAAQPQVVATIPVGDYPYEVAVNPITNRVYVANSSSHDVSVIDGASNTLVATIPLPTSAYPYGVAVNSNTILVYVTTFLGSQLWIIDGATDAVVTHLDLPGGVTVGIDINLNTNLIYAANAFASTVSVINGATNIVVDSFAAGPEPTDVAVNPQTNRLYVTQSYASNEVWVFDGATNTLVDTISVGRVPWAVALNAATNLIYAANYGDNTISVIDGAANTVVATIAVGSGPLGVGVNPGTNRIYVANHDSVSVIDGLTNSVIGTLAVGNGPWGVAVNSSTGRVYVANASDGTVSVIEDPSDTTPPAITLTTPAQGAVYTLNQAVLADYTCEDEPAGSGPASCVGDVPDGAAIDTASVGPNTFTVTAEDNAGNTTSLTHDYSVVYSFSGFLRPVDNTPTLNLAKAGSAIPVKFSLGGDQGLSILAAGYPRSLKINCDTSAPLDAIEETVTAGSSGLSYDPIADQYVYVWKTDKAWAGTCRQLIVRLNDGAEHVANFKFK